jgi:segregation and condensation protein B
MHTPEIPTIVESLLFASGTPVSLRQLVAISGVPAAEVRAAVARLRDKYAPPTSGVHLVEVAGGYQLRTAPACAAYVKGLVGQRRLQLSRAAVETLAIIAYRQPVTRGEIEAVRGVTVEGVLTALLTQKLVQILGRKEDSGRPWVYGVVSL